MKSKFNFLKHQGTERFTFSSGPNLHGLENMPRVIVRQGSAMGKSERTISPTEEAFAKARELEAAGKRVTFFQDEMIIEDKSK